MTLSQAGYSACFEGIDLNQPFDPSNMRLLDPVVMAATPAGRNVSTGAAFRESANSFASWFEIAAKESAAHRSSVAWGSLVRLPEMVRSQN